MSKIEYVDSDGRVPRGMTEASNMSTFRQILLVSIALANGGSIQAAGFETPESMDRLLEYELKVSGLGQGRILIEAVRKDHD